MTKCEGCDPPIEEGKREVCPDCNNDLADPHGPGCIVGLLETIYRDHRAYFFWVWKQREET